MSRNVRAGLLGVLAGACGVASGELVASFLGHRTGLITSVAEAVRDLTPGELAVDLVHLVGQLDKPLLLAGVVLFAAALAYLAGAWRRGELVLVGLGAVAALAAATRPGAATTAILPGALAAGVAILVRTVLRAADTGPDRSRRRLVTGGAVLLLAALAGGWTLLARSRAAIADAARRYAGTIGRGAEPVGADLDVPGLGPWRVPNGEFYRIDTALRIPRIHPDEWSLSIHGLVRNPITLTIDDLLARERTEAWVTLSCVSNPVGGDLVGNAYWSGVRIAPLLAEAGIEPGADAVLQTSADGWTCGTPLSVLTDDRNAMLAIGMNGKPLPIEHGFPVRMVVPGMYGFVSATKWLVDLEVSRFDRISAYWTQRGWDEQAPFKTQSRIDVPRSGGVAAGRRTVAGTAWAPHTGIASVELRVDGGAWIRCELGRGPDDSWVQWQADVELEPGNRVLTVRATDKAGVTQTSERTDVVPNGATGWHQVWVSAS